MIDLYLFVFLAGLMTALATGLGAVPFFIKDTIPLYQRILLWGLASGIMVAASIFGLFAKAVATAGFLPVLAGAVAGCVLVYGSSTFLGHLEVHPKELPEADFKKLLLILGVLTVHSFPEGVAVGVSFANLNVAGGVDFLGFTIPVIGLFMTLAISVHNIPEGVAVSIPLRNLGVKRWKLVWWSIFTSLPQPIGAVIAFGLVRWAEAFLPYGFGFAGGAMMYLVFTEFFPEALDEGEELEVSAWRPLSYGFVAGMVFMAPFLFL